MLTLLSRIVKKVSAAPDIDAALKLLVSEVKSAMDVTVCSVYLTIQQRLAEDGQPSLLLLATQGLAPGSVGRVRLKYDEGLVGLVAQRAEPVNLENAPEHERYKYFPETGEEALRSFLGVPIINYGKLLGVLVVQQRDSRQFEEDHVAFLLTLAAQLAGPIAQTSMGDYFDRLERGHAVERAYFEGLPGSTGIAVGTAVVVYSAAQLDVVPDKTVDDTVLERQRFKTAVAAVQAELKEIDEVMQNVLPAEERAIFEALAMMLESGSLIDDTVARIQKGNWAQGALRTTVKEHTRFFREMSDSYIGDRADDIRDLGCRILHKLQSSEDSVTRYPESTILVGDEISATQLAEVPFDRLKGVISMHGSRSSHVAILAHAMDIPAVMGAADLPVSQLEGKIIAVDGYEGRVFIEPDHDLKQQFEELVREERELGEELHQLSDVAAETLDSVRVSLHVNAGLVSDISPALSNGAEGVGLYRTEIPFQIAERFPSEGEQTAIYRRLLEAFAPRPCVLRTLDIGGDKALPYFPIHEQNPFLGWRGIRVSLGHPEIFITQIRAMLKANCGLGNLRILLPMIMDVPELKMAMELILRAHSELWEEGIEVSPPSVGVMIEVPASVYLVGAFAKHIDFFSIGSNDLTQYILAVDRNNERVGKLYDSLHPAVLSAILQVIQSAFVHNRPVSVCGELAGDPVGALLLLGMGLNNLSMSPGSLLRVKKVLRSFSQEHATDVMSRALTMENGGQVREMVVAELDAVGLGGLIRAGK